MIQSSRKPSTRAGDADVVLPSFFACACCHAASPTAVQVVGNSSAEPGVHSARAVGRERSGASGLVGGGGALVDLTQLNTLASRAVLDLGCLLVLPGELLALPTTSAPRNCSSSMECVRPSALLTSSFCALQKPIYVTLVPFATFSLFHTRSSPTLWSYAASASSPQRLSLSQSPSSAQRFFPSRLRFPLELPRALFLLPLERPRSLSRFRCVRRCFGRSVRS